MGGEIARNTAIAQVEHSYSARHGRDGVSPFFILYGKEMTHPTAQSGAVEACLDNVDEHRDE